MLTYTFLDNLTQESHNRLARIRSGPFRRVAATSRARVITDHRLPPPVRNVTVTATPRGTSTPVGLFLVDPATPVPTGLSPFGMDTAPSPRSNERLARLERTIENELIPRLLTGHRVGPVSPALASAVARTLSADDATAFLEAVRGNDDQAAGEFIRRVLSEGASIDAIYLDLMGSSARHLGTMWENDDCDFVEVTVAVGRMQRVMREISQVFVTDAQQDPTVGSVLLTCVPDEQHTLGIIMVGEFLLRDGWRVMIGAPWTEGDLLAMVGAEWYDVVGFSAGSESKLSSLRREIRRVRSASKNPNIRVMVGGPLFYGNASLAESVGAHGVARTAAEAPLIARALLPESRVFAPNGMPPQASEHEHFSDPQSGT